MSIRFFFFNNCCPNNRKCTPFVIIRPFSLRNNLVNRAVETLKSFAGSYSMIKYFFFPVDLNIHIKHISYSLGYKICFSIRQSRHTMMPYTLTLRKFAQFVHRLQKKYNRTYLAPTQPVNTKSMYQLVFVRLLV